MLEEIPENDGEVIYKNLADVPISQLLLYWNLKKDPIHKKTMATM